MIPFIVAVLTVIILLEFIPPNHLRRHWLRYVGICISVADFDVDDGVNLSVS